MAAPGPPPPFLAEVRAALGPHRVVTDPARTASHAVDWTGRFRASPPVVVRPATVDDVVAVVVAAGAHGVALVPQGGNTGLVGGATPLDGEVVVDLRPLHEVRDVDELGGQLTAGAGAPIAAVQEAARRAGWAYGVDWAARDTATVGGSVGTDAGGLRFVRHGSTRRQLLGVEAVLGTGEVISHLARVEKDNTGYDLGGLLCGSEGTLGVVTAARLRLVPPRPDAAVALVGFASVAAAVDAAWAVRRGIGGLEAVELMTAAGLELVCTVRSWPAPLPTPAPAVLLVEVAPVGDPGAVLAEAVAGLDGVVDAAVATDGRAGPACGATGRRTPMPSPPSAHPTSSTSPSRPPSSPGSWWMRPGSWPPWRHARTWCFGHAADGNVHVNVTGLAADDEVVAEAVLGAVAERGGSISAEHGIGRAKRRWVHLARTPAELAAMRAVKGALDPHGICNPGVLLP
ncbi:MAG: FAD-binding oxidoreductase [Acidimicrobiales bacterium]